MISILSPAKTLDYESPLPTSEYSIPENIEDSQKVMAKLKSLSTKKIGALMSISPELAKLNHGRNQAWEADFSPENARQAVLAFKGEAYRGMDPASFTDDDFAFAQAHLRILSGLHGLLRPLDLIRPYRLEMGTRLPIRKRKNLYDFWDTKIAEALNQAMAQNEDPVLLNLASNEYFKAVKLDHLKGQLITASFLDFKNGEYKTIMIFAKQARGMMASYVIRNRIHEPEEVKGFDMAGYAFNDRLSSESEFVFTRDQLSN